MGFFNNIITRVLGLLLLGLGVGFVLLYISYIPFRDGQLYLKNAKGAATILREADSGIQHIKAETLEMVVFA